jgi:hypothetical protein
LIKPLLTLGLLLTSAPAWSQVAEKRQLTASRASAEITVDGSLEEATWSHADVATGFTELDPTPGVPSPFRTEVRVLYDDAAVYIGAELFDAAPDSILKELSPRDEQGNTDWFGVVIDPYRDGINAFVFWVTPAGIEGDARFSALSEDATWDAVWSSKAKITPEGWTAEVRIPYSALRFPEVDTQAWAINFGRYVRRVREEAWWNKVDPEVAGIVSQCGLLDGISGIEPPLRLSVMPYVAGYIDVQSGGGEPTTSTRSFRGGLDLKYGINDAFTLDLTLIPDFGQVQSDEQVYNFTPFEVQFAEQRPFFTEGTELFNKGGLFYSRRIGGTPLGFNSVFEELDSTRTLISNPTQAQLINALKISGRTRSNLGIGVFNAIEARSFASVEEEAGEITLIETQPLTNYNVFVLDQGLRNNSYFALINTNVLREGSWPDANVVGTDFTLRDKPNDFAISGLGAVSMRFIGDSVDDGFKFRVALQKTSGNVTGALRYYTESDTYNPNDLGFLQSNNIKRWTAEGAYNIYTPFWVLKKMYNSFWFTYARLYKPDRFRDVSIGGSTALIFKNHFAMGGGFDMSPAEAYDYYEPRVPGRFIIYPTYWAPNIWISTNYVNKFALDVRLNYWGYGSQQGIGRFATYYDISPRYRVSDRFSFILGLIHYHAHNEVGWAGFLGDTVLFGAREHITIEQWATARYIFNNRMGLNLVGRHYWARAKYNQFFELTDAGRISEISYTGESNGESLHNVNYNAFTIDLVFSWFFAPGSEVSMVWKNAIFEEGNRPERSYGENIAQMFQAPQLNSFSVKLLYYIDWLKVKHLAAS